MIISPPSSSSVTEDRSLLSVFLCRRCLVFVYPCVYVCCYFCHSVATHSFCMSEALGSVLRFVGLHPPWLSRNCVCECCISAVHTFTSYVWFFVNVACFFQTFNYMKLFFYTQSAKFVTWSVFFTLFQYFPFYVWFILEFVIPEVGWVSTMKDIKTTPPSQPTSGITNSKMNQT